MNTAVATQTTTEQREWFDSWFDSVHYQRLYAHRDEREAARLIDVLIDRLRPVNGSAILDLGCGSGRHARHLASRGFNVTGLDLSPASIEQAKRNEHDRLRFVRGDMRQPFGTGAFDHVFNLFTSFGYFEDPADHLLVIRNIAQSLRPGGKLVLDYLNVRHAESQLTPHETVERRDVRYRISRWAEAAHIRKRIVIEQAGSKEHIEHVERVAKLSLLDFRMMFALYGMTIEAVYGDYRLGAFALGTSPRLILVATKKEGTD
jgi:SAM-dependent methyltransferase